MNTATTSNAAFDTRVQNRDDDAAGAPVGFAAQVLLALIRIYKLVASPYFAGSCRFLPSCADYARDAVLRHGAVRGSWLAVRRVARCHPLCAGGHDPVPNR